MRTHIYRSRGHIRSSMRTHTLVPYTPLQQEGFFQVERPLESQAMRFYAVRPALQTPCAIAAQPASCARP
jgi:hypothetical protein